MVEGLTIAVVLLAGIFIARELIETYNTIQIRKQIANLQQELDELINVLTKKGKK
jgi:hypothetical protein